MEKKHKDRLWESGFEDEEWIKLAQNCGEWRGFILTTTILQFLLPEC
jgi:hypothetical protein